jgi:ABC-type polysaccharide/polyol phosphate export permease
VRLASDDINGKYRRTVLGPLWIVIGQATTIAAFVLVFSGLFGMDPQAYAIYLAAGFPTWTLISSYLTDMPQSFITARGIIESYELPWLLHIWRRSVGYIFVFFHQIITLFVVMAMLGVTPRVEMFYVFPAIGLLLVGGTGVGMGLAVLGARYRDLQPAMTVVAGFLFLFTPVIWRAEQLRVNEWAVQFNPLYYAVTLLRAPLMGAAPEPRIWIGMAAGAVVAFVVGFLVFLAGRRRLYHWL